MVVKGKVKCQVTFDVEVPIELDWSVAAQANYDMEKEIGKIVGNRICDWVKECEMAETNVIATENTDSSFDFDYDDELEATFKEYEKECVELEEAELK